MPGLPKIPAADAIDVGFGRHDRRIILTGAEYGRIPVGFTAFLDTLEQRCRESE
jgi:hypothetical protein